MMTTPTAARLYGPYGPTGKIHALEGGRTFCGREAARMYDCGDWRACRAYSPFSTCRRCRTMLTPTPETFPPSEGPS